MENENRAFFNSPDLHKTPPIKRLGLSRKRKSCGSPCNVNTKIRACGEKSSDDSGHSEKLPLGTQVQNITKDIEDADKVAVNYDEQIELLKKRIAEDEEKLKHLKCNEKNINQLEDLIELWKNGCKNAFLHFRQFLQDRQAENINLKDVLSKLGVWETMVENFESDSEISLSEYNQ